MGSSVSFSALIAMVHDHEPGDEIEIVARRGGRFAGGGKNRVTAGEQGGCGSSLECVFDGRQGLLQQAAVKSHVGSIPGVLIEENAEFLEGDCRCAFASAGRSYLEPEAAAPAA